MAKSDYTVHLIDVNGKRWDLSTGAQGVLLLEDGLSDVRSQRTSEGLRLANVPGQVLHRTAITVEPVVASLRVVLDPDFVKLSMDEVWSAWESAWRFDKSCRLWFTPPGGGVPRWIDLRLGDAGLEMPKRSPLGQRAHEVNVPVVGDAGLFFETHTATQNIVTVANLGEVLVWPRVRWKGAGGDLTYHSGAKLRLPEAAAERVFFTDPVESGVITDGTAWVDERRWAQVRPRFISEPTPPGQSRKYGLFAGATLEWDLGFNTPWK